MNGYDRRDAVADGGDLEWPGDNLWSVLSEAFTKYADSQALTVMYQRKDLLTELKSSVHSVKDISCASWTFADLDHASALLSRSFAANSLGPGDTCASFLENGVEWSLCYLAAIRTGFCLAPLDATMAERPEELAYYLQLLRPKCVVVQDASAAARLQEMLSSIGDCSLGQLRILCDSQDAGLQWKGFSSFALAGDAEEFREPSTDLGQPLLNLFTSGTSTGRPKLCTKTQLEYMLIAQNYIASERMGHESRHLSVTVNFRAIHAIMLLSIWQAGGTTIIPSARFEPNTAFKAIISQQCTLAVFVPTMISAIAALPNKGNFSTPDYLRFCVGGDIVTSDMRKICKSVFGNSAHFFPAHGMTEGGATIGYSPSDVEDSSVPMTEGGILSIGKAQKRCRIRLVNPDTQKPVNIGEKGDLHLSSPNLITSYGQGLSPDDFYILEGSHWFKTGDVAMMDENGYIFILGRSKDIIKYHGVSLSPAVLEGVLNTDSEVQVKVVGLPDSQHGEVPVAFVKTSEGRREGLEAKVIEQSARDLGEDYAIHRVYFLEDHGMQDFPLNPTGKIVRRDLLDAIQDKNNSS